MARACHCAERPRAERRPGGRYSGTNLVRARGGWSGASSVRAWPIRAHLAVARAWDERTHCAVAMPVRPTAGVDLAAARVWGCDAAGEPGCLVYAAMVCTLPIGPCS